MRQHPGALTVYKELPAMYLQYYVYAYLRKDNTPYYIGKGQKYMAWEKHRNITTPADKSRIVILERNLSEVGAFAIERRMIRWYGRKIDGGLLRNIEPGGTGAGGKAWSPEAKLRFSQKKKSESHKKSISVAKIGTKQSVEHKANMSIAITAWHAARKLSKLSNIDSK